MIYLLDTDICIYLIIKKNRNLIEKFKTTQKNHPVAISSITYAELQFGIQNNSKFMENQIALAEFLTPLITLDFDEKAGIQFGKIRVKLQSTGKIIGPYDMLIAAHALSLQATLITNNNREYSRVEGLHVENWL